MTLQRSPGDAIHKTTKSKPDATNRNDDSSRPATGKTSARLCPLWNSSDVDTSVGSPGQEIPVWPHEQPTCTALRDVRVLDPSSFDLYPVASLHIS
jgi:hypothetical protein